MKAQALKQLKGLVAERKFHLDAIHEHNYSQNESSYSRSEWIEKRDELEDQISFLNNQIALVVSENL